MPQKKITKIFNYSNKDLINLVLNIDEYKNFLPWCLDSKVISLKNKNKNNIEIIADLKIGFKSYKEIYTSRVEYDNINSSITVTCIKGNIRKLLNTWKFNKLDSNQCSVDFYINIELNNFLLNILFSKFFNYGFDKILESFEDRAKKIIKKKF